MDSNTQNRASHRLTHRYALTVTEIAANGIMSGVAFADDNGNNQLDSGEWPLANQLISVMPGPCVDPV